MDDRRVSLIRGKNRAFHAYTTALSECERRRHKAGVIPETWLVRLGELARAYRLAVVAWELARKRWNRDGM